MGLDGSLFKKEQGGHTFSLEPHGAAMACCPIPGIPHGLHASELKGAEVATANTDRGRAPGLVSAFLAAPTKRFSTARRAVPHAS